MRAITDPPLESSGKERRVEDDARERLPRSGGSAGRRRARGTRRWESLRQDASLLGDRRRQHDVERRETIARDDEQLVAEVVDVRTRDQPGIFRDRVRGDGGSREVDGRVSESEIRVARGIMRGMNLTAAQVRNAIDASRAAKAPTMRWTSAWGCSPGKWATAATWRAHSCKFSCRRPSAPGRSTRKTAAPVARRERARPRSRRTGAARGARARLRARTRQPEAQNLEDAYRVLGVPPRRATTR